MLALLLFIVFLIPFVYTAISVQSNISDIRSKFLSYIDSNQGLSNILLLAAMYYAYIRTDGNTTIKNKPINEEWDLLMKQMSENQTKLLSLLIYFQKENTCTGTTIKTLEQLIRGDLCSGNVLTRLRSNCPKFAPGLLSNGIQGLNSYALSTMNTLKKQYDNSLRGQLDKFDALSQKDIVDMDILIATFQSSGYSSLQTSLQACTMQTILTREDDLVQTMKIYLSVFVCIIPILAYLFLKKMDRERIEWRKVFRKIPIEIVSNSKILKHHLVKENNFRVQIN